MTGIDGVDGFTAEVIGPGLYITNTIPFTITTEGPSQSESIYAFTDEIQNISRLPAQAKNGYVVKVVNSSDIDIDDMYVKFVGTNGDGTGTWEETAAPGVTYKFDPDTMPHRIRRVVQANGDEHFVLEPFPDNISDAVDLPWNNRLVGDDTLTLSLVLLITLSVKCSFIGTGLGLCLVKTSSLVRLVTSLTSGILQLKRLQTMILLTSLQQVNVLYI